MPRKQIVHTPELHPVAISSAQREKAALADIHFHIGTKNRSIRHALLVALARDLAEKSNLGQSPEVHHARDLIFGLLESAGNYWNHERWGDPGDPFINYTHRDVIERYGSRVKVIGIGGHDLAIRPSPEEYDSARRQGILLVPFTEVTLNNQHVLVLSSQPEYLRDIRREKSRLELKYDPGDQRQVQDFETITSHLMDFIFGLKQSPP